MALLRLDSDRYYVSFGGAGSISGSWTSLLAQDCSIAGAVAIPTEVNQVAIAAQTAPGGPGWYVGIGENVWLHRLDTGHFLVSLIGDCSPSSYRIPIDSNMVVGVTTGVLGLTLSAALDPVGILQSAIFDIQR
jgi:hypothetical protein